MHLFSPALQSPAFDSASEALCSLHRSLTIAAGPVDHRRSASVWYKSKKHPYSVSACISFAAVRMHSVCFLWPLFQVIGESLLRALQERRAGSCNATRFFTFQELTSENKRGKEEGKGKKLLVASCLLVSLSFPKNLETKSFVQALLQGSFPRRLSKSRAAGGASSKKCELSCVLSVVATCRY